MRVNVYLQNFNLDDYEWEDLDEATRQEIAKRVHRAFMDGWHPDDPMHLAFTFEYDDILVDDPEELLEAIFYWFNVGHEEEFGPVDELAVAYRAQGNRSLSMGDVVTLDGDAWAVRTLGWQHIGDAFTPPMPKG